MNLINLHRPYAFEYLIVQNNKEFYFCKYRIQDNLSIITSTGKNIILNYPNTKMNATYFSAKHMHKLFNVIVNNHPKIFKIYK